MKIEIDFMDTELGSLNFDKKKKSQETENPNEIEILKLLYSTFGKQNVIGCCMFGIFSIISIIVGVLVVYFTSPDPSNVCNFDFKRTMKSSVVSDSDPRAVALGDVNNDHLLDIVAANSGTDTIGVFLSLSNSNFTDQQAYPTGHGSHPTSLVLTDFNNDTYLDVAVANYGTNNIGIFLGNKTGGYAQQKNYALNASRPVFIVAVMVLIVLISFLEMVMELYDIIEPILLAMILLPLPWRLVIFNQDNSLDIAVANSGTDNVGIFLGIGDGTFTKQYTYSTSLNSNPSSIITGDLDNDNHLDLLVTNSGTGSIGIFLGNGNGTFSQQTTFSINSEFRPTYIQFGNFDQDTQIDVVVVVDPINDEIYIFLRYANKTFATTTIFDGTFQSFPCFVAVADFNEDNQSDIVIVNYETDEILLLSNYFILPSVRQTNYLVEQGSAPSSVIVYDFNNDSQPDLVTNNAAGDSLLILFGNDNGTYDVKLSYSTGIGSFPERLCIGDLNNDKRMDIVIANYGSDSIGILIGENNGTFSNVITVAMAPGSKPVPVSVGDFNNDTQLDIVVGNTGLGGFTILHGHGDGNFTIGMTYAVQTVKQPLSIVVEDINKDKYLDLVIVGCTFGNIGVFFGYGNGNFSEGTFYLVGSLACPTCIVLSDLNNDTHLDFIITVFHGGYIGVMFGYGNGTFQKLITYPIDSTTSLYSIALADLNKDDQLDVIVVDTANEVVVILYAYTNGSLQLERRHSTGFRSNPYAVTTVQRKNKTEIDIVVTLLGTGYVAVLTEYDAAEFQNETRCLTGESSQSYSVTVGDFNGDRHLDIAVVNSGTDDLIIVFNSGNGTFERQIQYFIGFNAFPAYVTTEHLNRDNYLDIVTVNWKYNSISVLMGQNNGIFSIPKMYSTGLGSYPMVAAIGDINNDNRSDIIIANSGVDSIGILFGYDYATFESYQNCSDNNTLRPEGIITADFNNDGYLDIAVTLFQSNSISILLGYGNGSFELMKTISTGLNSQPYTLTAYDFNKDGSLDIAVVNSGTQEILILRGYGNGTFLNATRYPTENVSSLTSIISADINNDNHVDMIVSNYYMDSIDILFGCGNFTFDSIATYSIGSPAAPQSVAVADFDNDSQLDIVVANHGANTVTVFLGYVKGNFTSQISYSTGVQSWPSCVIVGDFNRDNQLDIAISNFNINNVGILLGYGNGSFSNVTTYSTGDGSAPHFIGAGDFNNDSILDIAVVNNGNNGFVVLFGFGDGSFLCGNFYGTGQASAPWALAIGDFNEDNRLDIAVTNSALNSISIFLQNGKDIYAGMQSYSTGSKSQPYAVAVADLNSDGLLDIVVANYGTDNIGIFLGRRGRVFSTLATYSTGTSSGPSDIDIADLNNDNQLDIVVSNYRIDNIAILFGYGNGSFYHRGNYSTGDYSQPSTVVICDFNNDKILDIAVANSGTSNIFILYGFGHGIFGNESVYNLGFGSHPYSIATGDFDENGWMDLTAACTGTNHVETLIKMC
ncbi:unnamed protein product [Rotaria socialis]|uniref:Uncharacterized protein n=1 Tax=Rotaria socialis TaxID=392032 RepID=A0A820TTX0_9BILA|nr:unnamed protein product [Rotaria socialis]